MQMAGSREEKDMRHETFDIKNSGSQDYAALHLYLLDDSKEINIHKRPMIIICPGGGYHFTSDREAEIVATAVCSYGLPCSSAEIFRSTGSIPGSHFGGG